MILYFLTTLRQVYHSDGRLRRQVAPHGLASQAASSSKRRFGHQRSSGGTTGGAAGGAAASTGAVGGGIHGSGGGHATVGGIEKGTREANGEKLRPTRLPL